MIRHAGLALAVTILPLAVAMIESAFGTLLVPAVRVTALAKSRPLSASGTAITLTAITTRAEKEQSATFGQETKPLP